MWIDAKFFNLENFSEISIPAKSAITKYYQHTRRHYCHWKWIAVYSTLYSDPFLPNRERGGGYLKFGLQKTWKIELSGAKYVVRSTKHIISLILESITVSSQHTSFNVSASYFTKGKYVFLLKYKKKKTRLIKQAA